MNGVCMFCFNCEETEYGELRCKILDALVDLYDYCVHFVEVEKGE